MKYEINKLDKFIINGIAVLTVVSFTMWSGIILYTLNTFVKSLNTQIVYNK